MIAFDSVTGYLVAGVHSMDWSSFKAGFGWNARRAFLANGLRRGISNLKAAGCRSVLVDGSFVSSKDYPGDYDAAFDPVGVDGALVDPVLLKHDDQRTAMKAKYYGEFFPWGAIACSKTGMIYRDFFQFDRSGVRKGIVQLDLQIFP